MIHINKLFVFQIPKEKRFPLITIEAPDEKSAKNRLIRRRNYYYLSYSQCYQATLIETKTMPGMENSNVDKLVEELKKQTGILKDEYVFKCIEYATREYHRFNEAIRLSEKDRLDRFFVKYEIKKVSILGDLVDRIEIASGPQNERAYWKMKNEISRMSLIVNSGLENHKQRAEKDAIEHYENSIMKLAIRIRKKKLNEDAITIKTSKVGINIETILTDGNQAVKAWTIIAEGPIQKPHYRYLIR